MLHINQGKLWVHWGHRKCISQGRGEMFYPNTGPDPELQKSPVWNVTARADFHCSRTRLPEAKVPYLGMALFHVSLAILPAGDKSPVTHNSNYLLSPLSPPPLSGDRSMPSSGASWMHPVTRDSNAELTELISTVSLFSPGLCRWFPSPTSPQPPPPWSKSPWHLC